MLSNQLSELGISGLCKCAGIDTGLEKQAFIPQMLKGIAAKGAVYGGRAIKSVGNSFGNAMQNVGGWFGNIAPKMSQGLTNKGKQVSTFFTDNSKSGRLRRRAFGKQVGIGAGLMGAGYLAGSTFGGNNGNNQQMY